MIAVGLTGTLASGKGILASYSQKNGFVVLSLSNEVRQEALNRQNFNASRADLQNIGNDLRTQFGRAVLAMRVLNKLTPDIEFVVFDGIRNPGEMEHLQIKIPGIVFVGTDD